MLRGFHSVLTWRVSFDDITVQFESKQLCLRAKVMFIVGCACRLTGKFRQRGPTLVGVVVAEHANGRLFDVLYVDRA